MEFDDTDFLFCIDKSALTVGYFISLKNIELGKTNSWL